MGRAVTPTAVSVEPLVRVHACVLVSGLWGRWLAQAPGVDALVVKQVLQVLPQEGGQLLQGRTHARPRHEVLEARVPQAEQAWGWRAKAE